MDSAAETGGRAGRWHLRRLAVALFAVVGLLVVDLMREPQEQLSARALVGAIDLYQRTLSPWTSLVGARCRFEPSCSRYAEAAIENLGTGRGLLLTAARLTRCGPWTPQGTVDPPPGVGGRRAGWNSNAGSASIATPQEGDRGTRDRCGSKRAVSRERFPFVSGG